MKKYLKIITISGKAGAGKSNLATHLKNMLEQGYGMKGYIINFADPLKMICKEVYEWDGQKGENGRNLLQQVGTDIVQSNNKLCWVNCVVNIIEGLRSEFDFVIVGDARFQHEINGLHAAFEGTCTDIVNILVVNKTHENTLSEEQRNHLSEKDLDEYSFDWVMDNSDYNMYKFFKNLQDIVDIVNIYG